MLLVVLVKDDLDVDGQRWLVQAIRSQVLRLVGRVAFDLWRAEFREHFPHGIAQGIGLEGTADFPVVVGARQYVLFLPGLAHTQRDDFFRQQLPQSLWTIAEGIAR